MKDETLDKANELKEKIKKVKVLLQNTEDSVAYKILFVDTRSDGASVVVCEDFDSIENIRTQLTKVHEDNLKAVQDEFDKL